MAINQSYLSHFKDFQNRNTEYAQKMIDKGFQLVTVGSDQRFMSGGAKEAVSKFKKIDKKEAKGY